MECELSVGVCLAGKGAGAKTQRVCAAFALNEANMLGVNRALHVLMRAQILAYEDHVKLVMWLEDDLRKSGGATKEFMALPVV